MISMHDCVYIFALNVHLGTRFLFLMEQAKKVYTLFNLCLTSTVQ